MNLADLFIAKKLAGGGGGGTGTDNYNDLSNKPQINSTALTGDKSASDLGLQSEIDSDNKISADYVDDTSASNKFVSAAEKLEWSGKQDAIDADHKIDADYVDDTTSDNKFVTASDKTAWNAKQNAIDSSHKLSSDLVDDTGHTNLFVTSTEKSTWTGKQDKIDSSHKLSSTLVSFDSSEAAALASGIDSTKVSQIATNQTNILYVAEKTGKNLVNPELFITGGYISNSNGTVQPSETLSYMDFLEVEPNTEYYITPNQSNNWGAWYDSNKAFISGLSNYGVKTAPANAKYLRCTLYDSTYATTFMVCRKTDYDISSAYQPYALPNYDLTYLEAEDRAALAEEIDAGAKNLLQLPPISTWIINSNVTATVSGNEVIVTRASSSSTAGIEIPLTQTIPTNTWVVLSGCPANGSDDTYRIDAFDNGTLIDASVDRGTGSTAFKFSTTTQKIRIRFAANTSYTNLKFSLMVATKAAFGVSSKFVPYRPNYDLVLSQLSRVPFYVGQNGNDNYFGVIITGPNRGSYSIDFMSNNGVNGFGNIIVSTFYTNGTWNAYVNTDASYNVTMKLYSISSTSMAIMFYASNKWAGCTISGGSTDQMTIYRSSTAPSWTEITQQAFPTT